MFGRRKQPEAPAVNYMDPEIIKPFERADRDLYSYAESFGVKAVLFATGELKRLDSRAEVFGLVLAGYNGLEFGDDGTYTGWLATEQPLDWSGIHAVETIMTEEVQKRDPAYVAEAVGIITVSQAAAMLDHVTKQAHGLEVPDRVTWEEGGYENGGFYANNTVVKNDAR